MNKYLKNNSTYALGFVEGLIAGSWKCYDCGNIYGVSVDECPNRELDQANADLRSAKYKEVLVKDESEEDEDSSNTHHPLCPNHEGTCCPWMGDCDCQCLCDFINKIKDHSS